MSGDEKMREAIAQRVWKAAGSRNVTHAWIVRATLDALEPLTLKTEDGRFVKVRRLTDPYDIDAAMADHSAIYILEAPE